MRIRDMLAKQSKSMARLQQDSPEHATAAETASSKRRRKQKKLVPRPATKSENLLVGRLVARAASEIAAGSAVIPKEVVDMIVRGVHPIRAFRVHRHMSQIQLCAAARIAQAHLSGLENARIKPKLPTLKKLAVALNVPSDLLNAVK